MMKTAQEKGGGEDDASSSLSSESVSNNRISQAFLQQVEGHYCYLCCEQHYLTTTNLATFETEAQCTHVYCYVSERPRLSMEILHVPSACALLWTLSIISPLDLTMDSPTRGTFCRRYWEEVTAIFAPYATNGANYVTLIWEQWTLQSNAHTFFALTVFQHISVEELRKIYHSNV